MRIILKAWQKHRALDPSLASIIQLDFYSFLDAELHGHYNNELNALALRLLPLCRCVLRAPGVRTFSRVKVPKSPGSGKI